MANINFDLHKIFVEGSTDQGLVQYLLETFFYVKFDSENAVKNAIINCQGWNNIKNQPALIDSYRINNNGKNLILFDADSHNNDGGFEKRTQELLQIAKEMNVDFKIFLLPSNEINGDLEDFYATCMKSNLIYFDTCWNNMISCIKENNKEGLNLKFPKSDGKIFSYVDLFSECKTENYPNKKTKRNYFDDGLWEFDPTKNKSLEKIINFIKQIEE